MPAPPLRTELTSPSGPTTLAGRLAHWLQARWWQPNPGAVARLLQPLSWVYLALARWHRRHQQPNEPRAALLPVPVVVVGNLIVGGAGKTPTAIALVQHLCSRGWRPGIVSRGYGRASPGLVMVEDKTPATECGDEPLLMHLRTGVPVAVARQRLLAAQALLKAHPEVNIIVSDDGLQHWRLPRDVQVLVFDGRGVGNGLLLPAGPLRQPLPDTLAPTQLVLYNAEHASTRLPGAMAQRGLSGALSLAAWWQGEPSSQAQLDQLAQTSGQSKLLAVAGMADPERFFTMLEHSGCRIQRWPLADHANFTPLPWPADATDVLLTEKDAVKLLPGAVGSTRVWVVTLDFQLPPEFTAALDQLLPQPGP